MTTAISEVARYVQLHEGEIISNQDIANALHIPQGTASSSMHKLMENLPIRKIAKGVYVYETTIRESIERALQKNGGQMTIKDISEATGMPSHQVGGNISHLVRNPESPIIRPEPGIYQYSPEKVKASKPDQESLPIQIPEPEPIIAIASAGKRLYFEEIDYLEDGTILLQAEDGRILTAKETKSETARIVRFGNRIHVIK
jgi:hypothetical protein